jgi:L-malate glycosyltransferase
MIELVLPEHRLRICVLGDLDGVHTQEWLRYFVQRGHDVHGVSYYTPARPPEGVQVHALRAVPPQKGGESFRRRMRPGTTARLAQRLPIGLQRLANLVRYRRAGLRRAVAEIAPDVLHAHYLVEHGLYGTAASFRPYVVSAWGSDVFVEPQRSALNRALARFTLRRATLATANNRYMLREMVVKLGIEPAYAQHIVLGVSRDFLEGAPASVNALAPEPDRSPVVISTRSLDTPLYNIDVILRAMARVRRTTPDARLLVVGEGRLRSELEALAQRLGIGDAVTFTGFVSQEELRRLLAGAEVFVSVPSSDGTSVALLQAMGAGSFPIVSDLPSQEELVDQRARGFQVPVRNEEALAEAIVRALKDGELRRNAVERNRTFVEEHGMTETNMARMEAWYYRLAGRAAR